MPFPEFQSALTAAKEGQYNLNTTHRLPSHNPLPPSYILIRVSFVALNPCNWKMMNFSPAIGTVGGNDFSGRVVAIGSAVCKWQIGESVCGFLYGLDPHVGEVEWAGSFAEYVSVPEDLVMLVVEDQISMAEAACLGAGVVTAGMALWGLGISLTETALDDLSLRDDDDDDDDDEASGSSGNRNASACPYILVYGGSTATGTMAIQLARLAGYCPITTSFDYRSASCGVAIRAFTKGKLSLILDCITSTDSMKICYAAMGARGGVILPLVPPATRIQTTRKDWYALVEQLVEKGLLRPHPASVQSGGRQGILEGIGELRCGLVGGKKLVYPVGE
ncbi:chaperonin 10-like protein [Aspergillus pseudocaelatus]|uniref:Chaperonin 10-like protein n=1 Tax=Aspergillus pseudocaelatus TaxID=1825620 RepID=A0ABQ6X0G8_9EURO|nr:chaperonin 10-like protein [Aspergillus pseudocaelatus]